eukprot:scaffold80947_cov29-Tisochrysis_lutea.AAC.2
MQHVFTRESHARRRVNSSIAANEADARPLAGGQSHLDRIQGLGMRPQGRHDPLARCCAGRAPRRRRSASLCRRRTWSSADQPPPLRPAKASLAVAHRRPRHLL